MLRKKATGGSDPEELVWIENPDLSVGKKKRKSTPTIFNNRRYGPSLSISFVASH